jgi:hypothetical protein
LYDLSEEEVAIVEGAAGQGWKGGLWSDPGRGQSCSLWIRNRLKSSFDRLRMISG